MNDDAAPMEAISDRDLVLNFESIGDNCEFGLVQRRVGAEPLGLLRFSSAPIARLVPALRARFEGLADPANVHVREAGKEYMIQLAKYDFVYHAYVNLGEVTPEALHRQQTRILPFLVNKLIGDLEAGEKIAVFRRNEPLDAGDLVDLRMELARYGPVTLLWVREARSSHPAGSVDRVDDTLMVGYVRRLASRENAPDLDLASWLTVLRGAYALWRPPAIQKRIDSAPARPVATPPATVEIVFGTGGNAGASTDFGWSPPEDNHTWAIDDRSLLRLARPADAPAYRLDMNVTPFVHPPELTAQKLEIAVNGELVHTIDAVEHGDFACTVPGGLIRGRDHVEILLTHPNATRPTDLGQGSDPRRLAVMFRRLTLTALTEPAAPPKQAPVSPALARILFGKRGAPRRDEEYGWAAPEHDHTWAVGERSLLILDGVPNAADYRLEFDVVPFLRPPALTAQRLEVIVSGESVHAFDPVPFGRCACVVPGRLVRERARVEIVLAHPRAASPRDLGFGQDKRLLSVAFRRVTVTPVSA